MIGAIAVTTIIVLFGSMSIQNGVEQATLKKIEKICKPNQHVKSCLKKVRK